MRKVFLLILVFVCSVALGQGEVVKKGQKVLTRNAKILKAHYLWEYNEPSDWINIRYCSNDEILISTTDSINQRIYLYCIVASSGKYIVEIYGGEKSDTLIKKQLLTSNAIFDYTIPTGKGKHYGSNGFTQYKIRIYPEIKTKKITSFQSASINSGYLLVNVGANLSNISLSSKSYGKGVCLRYVQIQRCTNLATLYYAFAYCPNLQYITLPKTMNNLTSLGSNNTFGGTFSNCSSLKRIIFPDSLPKLTGMYQTFIGCSALEYVKMPIYAPKISNLYQAFSSCTKLKTVQFPIYTPLLTDMYQCFSQCSSLVVVRLPEITNLKTNRMDGIFARCVKLETVNLGGITQISSLSGFFSYCPTLKTVTFPKMPLLTSTGYSNVIETGLGTFKGSTGLRKLILPDSVPHLKSVYNEFFYQTSIDTLIFFKKADSLITFPSILTSLVSVDTFSTCIWGNQMVTFNITIKDLKYFIQPTLKVNQLILRGVSLATASALHTIDIDWANSTYGGTTPQIDIRWNSLSATTIDAIFTALPVVTDKTINVAGNPGSATCTPTIASLKGWTVIII